MIAEILYEEKEHYTYLKNYSFKEKREGSFCKVILENPSYAININIDNIDNYLSVIIEDKNKEVFFYTLASYAYVNRAYDMFDVIKNVNKGEFYEKVAHCVSDKYMPLFKKQKKLVSIIYEILEHFFAEYKK